MKNGHMSFLRISAVVAMIFLLMCFVRPVLANPVADFWQPKDTIAELDGYVTYNGEIVDTFRIYCYKGAGYVTDTMNAFPVNDIHFTLKVDWDGDGDWEINEVVDLSITSFPWYYERTNPNNPAEKITLKLWYRSVGGVVTAVDKFGLLAPHVGLTSVILVATVATAIYVKRVKRRKEKQ